MRSSDVAAKLAAVRLVAVRAPIADAEIQKDRACVVGDAPVMVKVQEVPDYKCPVRGGAATF